MLYWVGESVDELRVLDVIAFQQKSSEVYQDEQGTFFEMLKETITAGVLEAIDKIEFK